MLKSSGRTEEIPVMGIEGWPQVVSNKLTLLMGEKPRPRLVKMNASSPSHIVKHKLTKKHTMERRVRGNPHARCGVGENLEIISKDYLSL